MPFPILTLAIALVLAVIHVLSPKLAFLSETPRSRWLSIGGGISVAYVFVHILPELAERRADFSGGLLLRAETVIFVIALAGVTVFYGLERLARTSAQRSEQAGGEKVASPGVFWLHIASFALYNALIGYLLVHREEENLQGLLLYGFAMSLHFVITDRGLEETHGALFVEYGRWVVAAAVLFGWGLARLVEVDAVWLSGLFAFLAGGMVLNVLKEELPEERESRFSAFLIGVAFYAGLLLAL